MLASLVTAVFLSQWVWAPLYSQALGTLAKDGAADPQLYFGLARAVAINSLAACLVSFLAALAKWHGPRVIDEISVWERIFTRAGSIPYLTIELNDGTVWRGIYVAQDLDSSSSTKDIAIGQPLRKKIPDSETFDKKSNATIVILNESNIKYVQAAHTQERATADLQSPEPTPAPDAPREGVFTQRGMAYVRALGVFMLVVIVSGVVVSVLTMIFSQSDAPLITGKRTPYWVALVGTLAGAVAATKRQQSQPDLLVRDKLGLYGWSVLAAGSAACIVIG